MSATSIANREQRIDSRRLPRAVLIAAVLSAVLNAIVYLVTAAAGVDLNGPFMGPGGPVAPLTLLPVVISSAVPAVVGGLLLWVLGRFTARPIFWFVIAAAAFGLLSLGAPLTLPVAPALQLALAAMHIVAAATITWALVSQLRTP